MSYYKFLKDASETTLKSVLDGNIMFSRIPELNDFSEEFAVVDKEEMDGSFDRISRGGCSEKEKKNLGREAAFLRKLPLDGIKDILMKTVKSAVTESSQTSENIVQTLLNKLPDVLQKTNADIQKNIGIFCVAEKFDIFPMWAHYADDARGFAVEYDNLDELFAGDETGIFNKLKKVVYYNGKRPAVTFSPSDLTELVFSKCEDWGYEREWRVVKPLSECRKEVYKNRDGKECERGFFRAPNVAPERYVKRIIVGWRGNLEEIKNIVSKYNSKIPVVKADVKDGNIVIP